MTRPRWRHTCRTALLAAFVVAATACGGGTDSGSGDTTAATNGPVTTAGAQTTAVPTTPTATAPPSSIPTTGPPSQPTADATRDGVVAAVAALPMDLRVEILAEIPTEEGVWAITKLAPAVDDLADGCRLGSPDGKYPEDFICTFEYGEVLLLDDTRSTILRAYPLPGVPAEHLAVTDDAVFCGRNGVLPMPDSMVCRIDRATLAGTVKVYQPGLDSVVVQPCFYPPANWTVVEEPLEMLELVATSDGVFARAAGETWTMLDSASLLVIERGARSPGNSV